MDSDCFVEVDTAVQVADVDERRKFFNLETSKLHALGDYPEMIETFGTTDSVSTQNVSLSIILVTYFLFVLQGELLHRNTKRRYARTNGRNYLPQMGEIERIEARLSDIHDTLDASMLTEAPAQLPANLAHLDDENLPTVDAGRSPYQMGVSQNNPVPISTWTNSDPASKVSPSIPMFRMELTYLI